MMQSLKKSMLIVSSMMLLSSCTTVPVTMKFPEPPKEMLENCPNLQPVPSKTSKLSDLLETVSNNYSTYYECKAKFDGWVEWYNDNKKIYEDVK